MKRVFCKVFLPPNKTWVAFKCSSCGLRQSMGNVSTWLLFFFFFFPLFFNTRDTKMDFHFEVRLKFGKAENPLHAQFKPSAFRSPQRLYTVVFYSIIWVLFVCHPHVSKGNYGLCPNPLHPLEWSGFSASPILTLLIYALNQASSQPINVICMSPCGTYGYNKWLTLLSKWNQKWIFDLWRSNV